MPVSLSTLRSHETAALQTGAISKSEAEGLVTDAGTSKENVDALRDMLARDAFEPGARKVIQAAVDKADKAEKKKPAAVAENKVVGMQVGTLPGKVNVTVAKELGDPKGYKNEFEALGFARASGEKNAVAVKGKDGRWHAVQTNIEPSGKGFTVADPKSVIVPGPQITQEQMDALKQNAKNMEQLAANDPNMRGAADAAWQQLVGKTLGVDPSTINIVRNGAEPKADAINFAPAHTRSEAYFGNKDGNAERLPSNDKDTGTRGVHGIVLGPHTFRSPEHAAGVLAHEATHKEHHDVANEMLGKFRAKKETSFATWIEKQGLSPDIVDAIREQNGPSATSPHGSASSEVGAYAAEIKAVSSRFAPDHAEMKKVRNTLEDKWKNMTRAGQVEIRDSILAHAKTLPADKRAALESWVNGLQLKPCTCSKKPCSC